jgi:uncharacterized protein YjbJ (UPF0337 family)
MDSHEFEGQWKGIKGELKSWWGKLTDDDIQQISGNKDKLIGIMQQKYGYLYDEAQREIDRRLKELADRTHRLGEIGDTLKQTARHLGSTFSTRIDHLKAEAEDVANSVFSNETLRNLRTDLVQFIRRYPVQSLLIGFSIGYLLSRRSGK